MERYRRSGDQGKELPEEALGPYYAEALGLNPAELCQLDYETLCVHLAWREGRALAEWAATENSSHGDRQPRHPHSRH